MSLYPVTDASNKWQSNAKLSECCESYILSFAGCLCIEKLMAQHYHLESSSEMGRHVVLEQTTFCLYKTPWITVPSRHIAMCVSVLCVQPACVHVCYMCMLAFWALCSQLKDMHASIQLELEWQGRVSSVWDLLFVSLSWSVCAP